MQLEDIWKVKNAEISKLHEETNLALKHLEKTPHYANAKAIVDSIDRRLNEIQAKQDDNSISREEHIGTYRLNLMTMDQIKQVAQMAFADKFIEKMPKGYDTVVGDRGFRLSGGEKQRLTIARAILKNPPILILDEATSQLDSESEKYVQEALDKLMQGRTVIAIAHRLSTIMKADKIVVLEQGKIVGLGKHDDLLFSCPLYRRLYETQFRTA